MLSTEGRLVLTVTRTPIDVHNARHLRQGDHISFSRLGYKHHAIVWETKDDNIVYVIHITGDCNDIINSAVNCGKTSVAGVHITPIDISKERVRKYDHTGNLRTDGRRPHIVAGKIMQQGLLDKKKYDIVSFNCEHFATYCVTGVPYSKQMDTENKKGKNTLDALVSAVENKCFQEHKATKEQEEQAMIRYIDRLIVPDHSLHDCDDNKSRRDGNRKQVAAIIE